MPPPPPDYNQFEVGATLQPLASPSANTALRDADPAIYFLLDFIEFAIAQYPGPRIVSAALAAQVQGPNGQPITTPVLQAYPFEPTPAMLDAQILFPALFVYRTAGQTEQWTTGSDHELCGLTVIYAFPPLDAAQSLQMLPLQKAVYDAIRRKVNDGWDPAYTPPGGALGDSPFSAAYANLEEVGFGVPVDKRVAGVSTGFEYGRLQGTGDIWFPALLMRGYVTERDEYAPTRGGPSKFEGADIVGNVKANDGTVVAAAGSTVVRASTQLPPAPLSLDVATGPSTGGTTFTLTGLRFLSGPPQVYFGPPWDPTYATLVGYSSPTTLVVTTPAMEGAGVADLTVVNRDGQSGTLAGAFAFT